MTKVLLVDDDVEFTLLLKAKLEKAADLQISLANEGREALAMALTARPEVILLDVEMPEMDGLTVAAALAANEKTAEIPVVFLTSLVTPWDQARGVKAGGKAMVSKQTPIEDIVRAIDDELFKQRVKR